MTGCVGEIETDVSNSNVYNDAVVITTLDDHNLTSLVDRPISGTKVRSSLMWTGQAMSGNSARDIPIYLNLAHPLQHLKPALGSRSRA